MKAFKITTDEEYKAALVIIESLFFTKIKKEKDVLFFLVAKVGDHESLRYPLEKTQKKKTWLQKLLSYFLLLFLLTAGFILFLLQSWLFSAFISK